MAKSGDNKDMFTSESSMGGGDIESGSITPEVLDVTRPASPLATLLEKMEGDTNNIAHVEDLDKWVTSLENILKDVPPYMCNRGHPGRISRIPQNLRDVDVKGYEPSIMSIGPYHTGKPRMQQVEMRKKLVLKCVLEGKPDLTLKDFLKVVASLEPTIRSFYSDIEMESEQFVQMLLLDSVYLVAMFCGMPKRQMMMNEIKTRIVSRVESVDEVEDSVSLNVLLAPDDSEDEVIELKIGEHWYWTYFAHDLFLLENQVPFFLLQEIFNLAYAGSETEFIDNMKESLVYMLTDYTKLDPEMVTSRTEEVHHLLHLCHMFFRLTMQHDSIACHFPESSQMFRLGSAMQLYEAGVHFEARPKYSLLDVTFDSSGKMGLPRLHVDDNTESLLRNLIALEQMKYPSVGLNVSAYVVLLLHLITTPKEEGHSPPSFSK